MIDKEAAWLQSVQALLEHSFNKSPATVDEAIYYESHITLDPVTDMKRLGDLAELLSQHGFRLAKLYMEKGKPSDLDSFTTARDADVAHLTTRSRQAVFALVEAGFRVRRCKIEAALFDIRWKM